MNNTIGVIIPAGGIGTRMNGGQPKQFISLAGQPILSRTCQTFLDMKEIGCLVVVVPVNYHDETIQLLRNHLPKVHLPRLLFAQGGVTRQDSVRAGLRMLPKSVDKVLVHDGARPLIDRETILRCIRGVKEHGAAFAAVEVKDTLKRVNQGLVEETVDRTSIWQAQTPQGARRVLLERVFSQAAEDGYCGTDEASLFEHSRLPIRVVSGNERNIKITRPGDLHLAEALLREELIMKIGHGFDVHRLVEGRKLILGGVRVDFDLGLDGHSDADVLCHALTDAILGAVGAGDIGRHFPDNDPSFKGIDSLLLLDQVISLAADRHLYLGNADITVICQRPKLAPYLDAMRAKLAECCQVRPEAINIKATTTEALGYTGRGEGISAHAVVLMRSNDENR